MTTHTEAAEAMAEEAADHLQAAANAPSPDLWTTHPLSSGLPLFLIPELRAVSGNLRQPEVKCFAYK